MLNAAEKRARLSARLKQPGIIVAPGIYDLISAKIADRVGFDLLYMTGYGTVASYLGLPDAGLATYTDMVGRASAFAQATTTPLIADGDTGYGGLLNVAHTVRGYEAAGVSGIQLEDQEFPKKCGHTPDRRVIPKADMVRKIRVAADARSSKDFLIVARTDARTSLGIDEALRRAEAYAEAGADVLFVESPESVEEMERVARTFQLPVLINNVEGGRTPVLERDRLQDMGFKISIYPATGFLAVGRVLTQVYETLLHEGSSVSLRGQLHDFESFNQLLGFPAVWEFERTYAND